MPLEVENSKNGANLVAAVKAAYADLGLHNIDALQSIYRDDVIFIDPANTITGRDALLAHFRSSYKNVVACKFEFNPDTEIVKSDRAFLSWKMTYQHKKLNGVKPVMVEGASFLRFDQQIYWHRDWFDLGATVYEHIPLLGRIIRNIKISISS